MEIVEAGGSVGSVWEEGKCNGKVTGWRSEIKIRRAGILDWNLFCFLFIFFYFFYLKF